MSQPGRSAPRCEPTWSLRQRAANRRRQTPPSAWASAAAAAGVSCSVSSGDIGCQSDSRQADSRQADSRQSDSGQNRQRTNRRRTNRQRTNRQRTKPTAAGQGVAAKVPASKGSLARVPQSCRARPSSGRSMRKIKPIAARLGTTDVTLVEMAPAPAPAGRRRLLRRVRWTRSPSYRQRSGRLRQH